MVQELLDHPLGHIMFTGSTNVGKAIMASAAKHLTPVTLELGGKSPVVVTNSANIPLAAKRIAWGKLVNAGQTCVAADYALVEESVLPNFLEELKKNIPTPDAENPAKYGRIINDAHFSRLENLLSATKGKIAVSGHHDRTHLSIAPTIITNIHPSDALLSEEIFGPILPIISYSDLATVPPIIAAIDPTP